MLSENIERMRSKGLTIHLESSGKNIRVGLGGTCDMENLPHLQPFLDDLHNEAARCGAECVILDCDQLYFMNSASIKCFVHWIGKVNTLNPDQRYKVEFLMNIHLTWQHRSLSAIRRYAPDIVSLNPLKRSGS